LSKSETKELSLEKRSHHFRVFQFTQYAKKTVEGFARGLIQWGFLRQGRGFQRAPLKVFAASNFNRDEYRFHINQLDDFINYLRDHHIPLDKIDIRDIPLREVERVELPIKKGWELREHQVAPVQYIIDPNGPRSRLVLMSTGTGKSVVGMFGASRAQQRFIMVARPMFIDKWLIDIRKAYDIIEEDILVVKGGASLMALLEKCKNNNLPEKVILISNKTLQVYINNFERFGNELNDMGYDALPDELFQLLGGGIRNIDEVHLDFHFNFKLDLYTHTSESVSFTATFLTDDPHIRRMHEIAYPSKDRYVDLNQKKYINSVAVLYQFKIPALIRYTDYSGKTYSHHVFEQSVIKHKEILNNYLKLILDMVQSYYVYNPERKKGDKFIVFCSSIDMCTRVTKYLNSQLKGLKILRYVEDDPYENLMEPDGRVSTLLSAGTNVDIDQLTCTILTTAVNSSPSNVQGFGRLRELKDGRSQTFVYLTDMNNPKHMDYHMRKKDIIKPRSKNYKEAHYGSLI